MERTGGDDPQAEARPDGPAPESPPEPAPGAPPADDPAGELPTASLDQPVSHWQAPAPDLPPGQAGWRGIGSTIGRTFDTYGTAFGTFLALSAPISIFATMTLLAGSNSSAILLLTLVNVVVGLVCGAAMMLATDDLARGPQASVGDVLDRAAGRIGSLTLSALIVGLALGGFVVIIAIAGGVVGIATRAGPGSSAGTALVVVLVVALLIPVFILLMRWGLSGPAIAVDGFGAMAGLRRSRELTRGHLWRLAGLFVALGLIVSLVGGGASLLSTFAPDRALAAAGVAIATLFTAPLLGIAPAVAYRDLAGRRQGTTEGLPAERMAPDEMPLEAAPLEAAPLEAAPLEAAPLEAAPLEAAPLDRAGRRVSALAVVGVGVILGAAGIWSVSNTGGRIFIPDRGQVLAGTALNAADLCHPSGRKTTFSTAEEIWIAAVFSSHVPAGQEIIIEFLRGDQSLASAPVTAGPAGLDCYYETGPLREAPAGTYRIIVLHGSTTLADGTFTIR
jgi:hypothetical protein